MMVNKNKNLISSWIILIAVIILGVVVYFYGDKPQIPSTDKDGKIEGEYAIGGIMRLGKPYICNFEKSDKNSKIVGTIRTDGKNIYGEFRIKTDLIKDEFNSFLLALGKEAYTWTSLEPIGYKSRVAKSANRGASFEEQAQIIGLNDIIYYKCQIWQNVSYDIFETPSYIKFFNLKR